MYYMNKTTLQIIIIIIMMTMNLIMNNKMFLWMTLEISTMSFISMIILSKSYNSSIIYFIVSFISSTIMFIGLLYHPTININILIMVSILIKIAMFPFNYWFNLMSKSISYMNLSILMTLMKFIPLNIMHLTIEMNQFLLPMIMMSMIISPIMTMNKYSLKLIMSYSSIHQTSLMVMIMYMNFYMFILYFTLYSIITISLMKMLNNMNNKLKYEFNMNKKTKTTFFLMMMSYSYFPPMTTFIMKWSVIENMILMNNQFKLMSIIVMMSSFIMIWSYLNFMNNNIYNFNNFNKMFTSKPIMKNSQKELFMIWMMLLSSMIYMYFNF
uniref:NADH-ubiquinone oxidoreductase chain 2 n=1 Tax=Andrena flavipes TaxID=473392 RepID=A0A0S2LUB4_9HYME|nr:NADH dehydrogenase subunit 2 [Andrena flavipes]UPX88733.1 NADH dehydrogenase subunit 2 [Andrena flavipes]